MASNPLVMSAGVSKKVQIAETECPMHRTGLRRLQKMVDEMADEVPVGPTASVGTYALSPVVKAQLLTMTTIVSSRCVMKVTYLKLPI